MCFSGILYAVGGYDGATRQCLSTVEAYNPKSNTWSYIAEMGTRRSGAGHYVLFFVFIFKCIHFFCPIRHHYAGPLTLNGIWKGDAC